MKNNTDHNAQATQQTIEAVVTLIVELMRVSDSAGIQIESHEAAIVAAQLIVKLRGSKHLDEFAQESLDNLRYGLPLVRIK
jgi:hypothetical protein